MFPSSPYLRPLTHSAPLFRIVTVGIIAALATGCSDQLPEGPIEEAAESPEVSAVISDQDVTSEMDSERDIVSTPAFDISVEVAGDLRPGLPAELTANVTAILPTTNADVALYTPELSAAQNLSPQDYRVSVGSDIPARAGRKLAIGAGQSVRVTANAVIPDWGYYRVHAVAVDSVTPETDLLEAADEGWVQSEVHREVWILVTENESRVTEDFDADLVPDGYRPQPGPLRPAPARGKRPEIALGPDDGSRTETFHVASLASGLIRTVKTGIRRLGSLIDRPNVERGVSTAGSYEYQVLYNHGGINHPLPTALVKITHYPVWNGSLTEYEENIIETEAITDSQGRFWVTCYPNYDSYVATVEVTDKYHLRVLPTWVGSDDGDYDDCSNGTNLDRQILTSSKPSHVYKNMNTIVMPGSQSLLNRQRGMIDVELDPNASNSFYSLSNDKIVIRSTDGDDHVFGSFGLFVAGHEFGHAVHHKAIGGINPHLCPSPHLVREPSTISCALTEGFADYLGVAVGGPAASFHSIISRRSIPKVESFTSSSSYDPATIEGAFAAFLYDISDPAEPGGEEQGTAHDSVAHSGSYVAEIVDSCHYEGGRANGTDHAVHCFEQAIRSEVINHTNPDFFLGRFYSYIDPSPASWISEQASEPVDWDLSELRSLWLHNIYDFNGPRPL